MIISQLTVFLQNQKGRLEELTEVLAENRINISALSIAETEEYGIVRMIVGDTEKALERLREREFTAKLTKVVSLECDDVPGSLHRLLRHLLDNGISVNYMYGYSNGGRARMILKLSDTEKGGLLLREALESGV